MNKLKFIFAMLILSAFVCNGVKAQKCISPDLALFELYGNVQKCVFTFSDRDYTQEITFNRQGKMIKNIYKQGKDIYNAMEKIKRNADGCIVSWEEYESPVTITWKKYAEGAMQGCQFYPRTRYEENMEGDLKITYVRSTTDRIRKAKATVTATGMNNSSKTTYAYPSTDENKNWTVRRGTIESWCDMDGGYESRTKSKETVTRKITYFK